MRALFFAELVAGLRLDRVPAPVELLASGQRGQQQRGAEADRPARRGPARGGSVAPAGRPAPSCSSWLCPAGGVPPLGRRQLAIDAREALFALRGRHRVVEGGAVDLVAVVPPQTLDALAGHGTSRERRVRPAANSESSSTWPALRGSTITGQAASRTTRPATPPTSDGVQRAVAAGAEEQEVELLRRLGQDLAPGCRRRRTARPAARLELRDRRVELLGARAPAASRCKRLGRPWRRSFGGTS